MLKVYLVTRFTLVSFVGIRRRILLESRGEGVVIGKLMLDPVPSLSFVSLADVVIEIPLYEVVLGGFNTPDILNTIFVAVLSKGPEISSVSRAVLELSSLVKVQLILLDVNPVKPVEHRT